MSRHRSLPGADEEFVEAVRGAEDAGRRNANGASTPVVGVGNPRRIGSLVKLPEGFDARMYALAATQHFATDAEVRDSSIGDDGARDSHGPFGVIRGFPDPPLALRIPHITRDDRAGSSFETVDAVGIPAAHVLMRQRLGWLATGVTG